MVQIPQLPPPPPPAECTKVQISVSFAPALEGLPSNYQQLSPADRAKALLNAKNDDSQQYRMLRAQALRCAS